VSVKAAASAHVSHTTSDRVLTWAVVGSFCAFGAMWGVCHVILVDLQHALGISAGKLGVAMSIGVSASIPSMLISGRCIDRFGVRVVMAAAAAALAAGLLCFAVTRNYATLCLALVLLYGGSGAYDVTVNAAAIHVEQHTGRRIIAYFHGAFSGVAAIFAVTAGLLLSNSVPFRSLYFGLAAAMTGVVLLIATSSGLGGARRADARAGTFAVRSKPQIMRIILIPTILLVALIATLSSLSENALQSWSSIYLRTSLGVPVLVGSFGPAAVYAAMSVGRFICGYAVTKIGRSGYLRICGLVAAGGMGIALASDIPWLAISGFLVCGIAHAAVAPVAFSIGGDVAPAHAGQVSSAVATISYAGFLGGPVLIGGLAQLIGLRGALLSIVVAGLVITVLALWLREPAEDGILLRVNPNG
jgi:MFS family permease